jgi:hypothetical protein
MHVQRDRTCRFCGCTDKDCSGCVARTGRPCSWLAGHAGVCTACVDALNDASGVAPSHQEIAASVGLSLGAVAGQLLALERAGAIKLPIRTATGRVGARAIVVVGGPVDDLCRASAELLRLIDDGKGESLEAACEQLRGALAAVRPGGAPC